jgi:hypothetical protein
MMALMAYRRFVDVIDATCGRKLVTKSGAQLLSGRREFRYKWPQR